MKSTLLFIISILLSSTLYTQPIPQHIQSLIKKKATSLKVDENYQNGNYAPVIKRLKDKRLIFLGEFNHGSQEVFITRNELIQALHEQAGFNLILFESGLGEVGVIDLYKDTLPTKSLIAGFFYGWRNQAFVDLMQYAVEQKMDVAGFDVQRTGTTFASHLMKKLDNPGKFQEMETRFVKIKPRLSNYRTHYDSVSAETQILIKDYRDIKAQIDTDDIFLRRALDNRIQYLTYMLEFIKTKDWNTRWKARDQAMAENVEWILNQYPPETKAIIIAHNFHISRYNEKETVMGEFLNEKYDSEMYVLGAFAGKGTYHNNAGKPRELSPPDEKRLDVKHLTLADNARLSFLHFPNKQTKKFSWLNEKMIVNDTFIDLSSSNELILGKCFDGLLLLDEVSPPE